MTFKKAFTLIEVLIVIVVIGVLAGGFMYSSTEAITTAKATLILNNLDMVRNAVISFYTDNPDIFESGEMKNGIQNWLHNNPNRKKLITQYFDKNANIIFQAGSSGDGNNYPFNDKESGTYGVADAGEKDEDNKQTEINSRYTWFVGYKFKADESAVKEKIRARSKSLGLLFAGYIPNFNGDDIVWLRVFGEWEKPVKE